MRTLNDYRPVPNDADKPGFSANPAASTSWQWLLGLTFLMLFVGNNIFRKPTVVILLLFYLPIALLHVRQLSATIVRSRAMVALWIMLVASVSWSLVWRISLDIALIQTAFMLLALAVTWRHRIEGFFPALRGAAVAFTVLVTFYCLAFPGPSMSNIGLRAFLPHKNSLGQMLGLCVLVLWHAPERKHWHLVAALWAACLLALTQSKTSISLVAISSAAWLIAAWWGRHMYPQRAHLMLKDLVRYLLLGAILLCLILLVAFRDVVLNYLWQILPNDLLTGRGTLWRMVIQRIHDHNLLGIGPGVFWQAAGASEVAQTYLFVTQPFWIQNLVSADGSYADLLAAFGMLGLVIFLLTAVELYSYAIRQCNLKDARLIVVITTFVLLEAVSSSTIMYSTNILWFLYLLCYLRVVTRSDDTSLNEPR